MDFESHVLFSIRCFSGDVLSTRVCICVTGTASGRGLASAWGCRRGGFPGKVQPSPRVTLVWVLCYYLWLRASRGCRTLEAGQQLLAEAEARSTLALWEGSHPPASSCLFGRAQGRPASLRRDPPVTLQTWGTVNHGEQD